MNQEKIKEVLADSGWIEYHRHEKKVIVCEIDRKGNLERVLRTLIPKSTLDALYDKRLVRKAGQDIRIDYYSAPLPVEGWAKIAQDKS